MGEAARQLAESPTNTPKKRSRAPFAQVPTALLRDHDLTTGARLAYALLATYGDKDGKNIFPSVATLAKHAGTSQQTVRNWLRELLIAGWVRVRAEPGKSNFYEIVRDPDERDRARRLGREKIERQIGKHQLAKLSAAKSKSSPQVALRGQTGKNESKPLKKALGGGQTGLRGSPQTGLSESDSVDQIQDQEAGARAVAEIAPDAGEEAGSTAAPTEPELIADDRAAQRKRAAWEQSQQLKTAGYDDMTRDQQEAFWLAQMGEADDK